MKLNQAHSMNPNPPLARPDPAETEIQKEAYYLWVEAGRPEGRDLEFWHAATELLRHRHGEAGTPLLNIVHFPPSHAAQRSAVPAVKP